MRRLKKTGILVFAAIVLLAGAKYVADTVKISGNVSGRELPICSVETEKKQAALTFDAAWRDEDIDEILDILNEYDLKATFFVTGRWVEKYPEKVKKVLAAGHDIGNHSQNHKSMAQMTKEQCKSEIMEVHEKVKWLTGADMNLFRAPYGNYSDEVILTAKACGYQVVEWDVNSMDWKDYGAKSIVETVVKNESLQKGSIISMNIGTKYTKDALESVIQKLQKKGYELVPVSKMIYRENYHINADGRQIKD